MNKPGYAGAVKRAAWVVSAAAVGLTAAVLVGLLAGTTTAEAEGPRKSPPASKPEPPAAKPPASNSAAAESNPSASRSAKPPASKPPASKPGKALGPAQVSDAVQSIFTAHPKHAARLDAVSSLFLGARYQLSPLGEGTEGKIDRDPLVRYDAFDCVTYVEQVMALSWHPDHARATAQLQRIRYRDGRIGYGTRKHIMMAQWIPQNIDAGFVRDVTKQVAGKSAARAWLQLDHADYESAKGRALSLKREQRPLGRYALPIIPLRHMSKLIERIPHGTIFTSIRKARVAVPYRASHVGLVVVRDGKRMLRHAHKPSGKVIEQPLRVFVERSRRYRKWPVSGFNLLAIRSKLPAQ